MRKIAVGPGQVYVVASSDLRKRMEERGRKWEGSLTFEKVRQYLPYFKSAIQVPIFVLGLDSEERIAHVLQREGSGRA